MNSSSPFNKLGPSNLSGTSKMKSNPFDSKYTVRTDKNSNKALDRSQNDSYSIDRYNERSTSFGYINPNYIDRNRNKANNSQQSITQSQQQSILSDSDIHAQEFLSGQVNISHPTFKQLNSSNDMSMRDKSMQEKRIKYEYNEQGDTSSSIDYSVDDFVWRLNKEKIQFRKQSEDDSRTQSNRILTNYKNTPSMNSSPDHLRSKNNNFSQQEDHNIENFDNILEKQRRFYNMLARSQTLQSQKSREGDSSSPPSRGLQKNESPTLLNNTRKLSGQSSSMNASPNQTTSRNIDSSPGIREQFMMTASDQSSIENEMVRLNKKLKGYEKTMVEKQEEIDFMKSLLADAQNEVEKIKNQREKDFMMMTEINDRHSKDKKKLQNKLDQTLDKLLTSANVSVNHNISNRVDTSLNVIQALNSVEEEKLSLQNKLDQASKEIDFQKRSNETLRQRINNLLINQQDSGGKEDSKHKELTCLLKEYLHEIEDLRNTNQKLDFLLKQTKNQYEERNIYLTNQLEDANKRLKQMEKDLKPFQKDKEKQTMITAKLKEDLENKDKESQKEIDALTRKVEKLKHDVSVKDKDLQEEIVTLNLKIESLKEEVEREKKFNKKLSEVKLKGEDNQAIKEVFQDQIDELNLENEELKEKLIEIQNRTNELHRDNTGLKENLIENQKQTDRSRKEIEVLKEKLNQSMKHIEELGFENENLRHNLTEQEKALDIAKSEASKVEIREVQKVEIREIPKVEIREVFRDPTPNPADLEKIDQLQKELNEASEALIKLKIENEELASTKEAYISLRQDYSDLKQQHNAINKEFLDFKSSQAEIQQTLEDKIDAHLDEIGRLQNEVKNLQTEIKQRKVEKDGYVSQLEEMALIKQSLISNEQALKEAELEKKSLRGDIDNYESRLKKISNDYEAKLKKANQEIANQIEQVKILTSNKNTESVVKELRIQNEKAKEEINKLRKTMDQKISESENECFMQKVQNDQLKAILEDQDIKIKELEEKMKAADSKSKAEIDRVKASAEDYQNRLVLKEDEIKTLNNEIKNLKDRMSEQENKSSDAILTELKEELEQQKAIVEKQKTLMTRQKGDITDLKNKIEDQKLALKDSGADHDQLDAKVREQDHIIDGYAKQIESLIERITELSAKEQEYLQQIRTLKSKSKK